MQAQFAARVLSYCLGKGKLALKGQRQVPWLQIVRSELDHAYLGHQSRVLRRLHDGPVETVWDHVDSNSYYDNQRLRLQAEGLWRAYELLCPRDKPVISRQVLDVAGVHGMTALWLDQGRILGTRGQIKGRYTAQEYEAIAGWLTDNGIRAMVHHNQHEAPVEICLRKDSIATLIQLIRPLTHTSMKKNLRRKQN